MKSVNRRIIVLLLAFAMIFTSFGQISFAENKTTEEYKGLSEAIQNRERPAHQRSKISDSLKKEIAAAKMKEKRENPEENIRVIVELEEAPVILKAKSAKESDVKAVANSARIKVKKAEIRVKSLMRKKGIDFKEIYSLDTFVSGFSIYTKRKNIEAIKNIEGVKNVQISEKYTLPRPEKGEKPQMYASVNMIGAPNVWKTNKYKGEGQVVAVLDTGFDVNNKDSFRLEDESRATLTREKVEGLINEYGLKGKYYSAKIPYIYNYQDETAEPDALQDRYGSRHGLHVAGTIGANEADDYKNGNNLAKTPIKGVAPNAQLIIMKVFSTSLTDSSTYSDTQCKAIEDSYKLGADAMNLSLGSPAGFINNDDIVQVAFQNAIKAGCLVAVANGNEGTAYTNGTLPFKALEGNPDYGMAGTPANGWATTSVAAITNTKLMAYSMDSSNTEIKGIRFSWGVGLNIKKSKFNKFVSAGFGTAGDFANINSEKIKDALAIVSRGKNSFNEKAANAKAAGAKGLLVINSDEEDAFGMSGIENVDFPVALVGKTNGDKILSHINDAGFTLTYTDKESSQDNPNAVKMASFTSWGPTPALTMKPELTAPGADIYSIDQDNKYQVMSGTSMATPHVAGAAAIVAQFLKDKETVFYNEALDPAARQVLNKTLLMNTAIPQKDEETYYPVRRQGAGLIDLENLVKAKVTVKATSKNDRDLDAKAELKSFSDKEFTINYELKNYSDEDITYELKPSMMTEKFESNPDLGSMTTETDRNMNFTTDKTTVTAVKNKTTKFSVTFNFENDTINENNYVEGFLRFIPQDKNKDASLTVPYLGFYGDWAKPRIFDIFSHEWDDYKKPNFINTKTNNAMGDVFSFTDENDGRPVDQKLNQFEYNNIKDNWVYITSHNSSAALKIRFALLRNTEYIKTWIEDKDEGIIKDNVSNLAYFRKSAAANGNGENWLSIYKNAFAENALNKIVLKGKLNTEEENTQEVTLPVYFDDNAPELKAELIEEGGFKYAQITLSDDIGIDVLGVQQIKEVDKDDKGNPVYNYHKYDEVGGLYYGPDADGNFGFYTEDKNRKTVQDQKVIDSLKALQESNKENTVFIKVDDIADIEKLAVYTKDIAGNWANFILDTKYSSDETIDLKFIGENLRYWLEAGEAIEENDTIKIKKGTYGELQIVLPNDGKTYKIESALINNEEVDVDKFQYNQDNRFFYMPYRFDKNTTFSAKIVEVAPEPPAPDPTYPKGNGYPSIFLTQPENHWTVSENSPLNPQDSPEIENGKLNVIGAVGFTPLDKLKSITLRIIDDVNKEVISTKKLDLKNKDEVYVDATGDVKNGDEVVYNGLAVFFKTAIDLPKGYSSIKLQVEAENTDGKKTVTSVTLAIDESPATFNYTIGKRALTSEEATINFTLADDNKSTEMYVDRINDINNNFIETVYTKVYDKWDIDKTDSTRYLYKDKFNVELKPGFNKFIVYIRENGTARNNVRYIMIYRLADGRAKAINN